jgi:lipid-binding SYLF domain-containing protein
MKRFATAVAAMVLVSLPSAAQLDEKVADRFWASTKILEQLVNAPDGGIPQELLQRAECVGVIPAVKRAAFGVGGRYGRGLVVCRRDGGTGSWGPPSMTSLSGGSFGFQIGGQSEDVLMLLMHPDSIDYLLRDELTLGADVSVAAGPVGRGLAAETSATMRAEILTYSKSQGLFAGVSLEGAVIKPDRKANESLYGTRVDARGLLTDGTTSVPDVALKFMETLTKVASRTAQREQVETDSDDD